MEIEKYDLNDPRLFRVYEKQHPITYTSYVILDKILSDSQIDHINEVLASYRDDHLDVQEKYAGTPLRCKAISRSIPELNVYDDLINTHALSINSKVWNLDITGCIERRHLVYNVGDHAVWHHDGPFGLDIDVPPNLIWRKLSATVCLNDDYDGGEFEMIVSNSPETSYVRVKPERGSIILFPPFTKHRVAPVTAGTRNTLIYWYCGPRWR